LRRLPEQCEAPLLYVALGDSTVAGEGATSFDRSYPALLERRLQTVYPNARLQNLGIGGAVVGDVLDLQLRRAINLDPQLVTLSIGPNDINAGYSAAEYESGLRAVFDALNSSTEAVVVTNLIPDMSLARRYFAHEKARISRATMEFNHALEQAARSYDVELVDLYAPSRALGSGYQELLSADGFHPSDLGYDRWAEFMWFGIETRIACEMG
jgi:lysophospholipase L1-like esterase